MRFPVEWDTTRRSYIILTGRFRRTSFVKYIADKIRGFVKSSEKCVTCKCSFPIDAMQNDTFFFYVVIDGPNKEDVERCDAYIFSEVLKELESLGAEHRISNLSFPKEHLKVAYIDEEPKRE